MSTWRERFGAISWPVRSTMIVAAVLPASGRFIEPAGGDSAAETFFLYWLELEAQLSLITQREYTIFRWPLRDEERTSVKWADMFPSIKRCAGARPERPGAKPSRCPDVDICIHAQYTRKKKPAPSEWEGDLERPIRPWAQKKKPARGVIQAMAGFLNQYRHYFPEIDANPARIKMNLWRYRKSGIEARLDEEIITRRMKRYSKRAGGDERLQEAARLAQRVADFVYGQPERKVLQRELQRSVVQRPVKGPHRRSEALAAHEPRHRGRAGPAEGPGSLHG